jgi:hypothetical protein
MTPMTDFSNQFQSRTNIANFWERILNDQALHDCDGLEKLLVGCELIAAVDQVELLIAA